MNNTVKCPFLIFDNLLSPLLCEDIVDDIVNSQLIPNNTYYSCENPQHQKVVYDKLLNIFPTIQNYYNFKQRGTENLSFEVLYKDNHIPIHSENSEFINNMWIQHKARDISGVIFLNDYNDNPQFDPDFEVYGGKLEFIAHQFGFNPSRGTCIVFPSDPRFSNATSPILSDSKLCQIRFHLVGFEPWVYNPVNFPGNYNTWF